MLEAETQYTAQFGRQACGDDAEPFAHQPRISALEIEGRIDADRFQARGQPTG